MITSTEYLTPCEYLKKANDLVQGDEIRDVKLRELLAKSERLAKEMSKALSEYEPKFYKRYSSNKTCVNDWKFRGKSNYKYYKID